MAYKKTIDWRFPPPRTGLPGVWDRFVGPGATRAEIVLQLVIPVFATIAAYLYASQSVQEWTLLQYTVCCVLAFDIAGGIVTNSTSSAKRWYHRAGQGPKQHFGMVSLHIVHVVLVSWLFLGFDMQWIAIVTGYLFVAAIMILSVPLYLQRTTALAGYSGGVLIALYFVKSPAGLEWFLPLFYLKLLMGHLSHEEPYRP